jgi:hypothetical protein
VFKSRCGITITTIRRYVEPLAHINVTKALRPKDNS